MAKRSLENTKYKYYNKWGVLKGGSKTPAWSIKDAKDFARIDGESYITIMEGKKITSLKCVRRYGKNGLKKCTKRSKKACKSMMRIACHPTKRFKPTKWYTAAQWRKRKKR